MKQRVTDNPAFAEQARNPTIRPWIFLATAALYLAVGYFYTVRLRVVPLEAIVRTGIVFDLFQGTDLGRQGLVCSVLYPPLPTLFIALLGLLPMFLNQCFAAVVLSSLSAAGTVVLLDRVCEVFDTPRIARVAAVVIFSGLPTTVLQGASGTSSSTLLVCSLALILCALQWERTRQVRYLLGCGLLCAILPLISWQGLTAGVTGLLAIVLAVRLYVFAAEERRGLYWALAFPPLFALAAMTGLNWVIMQDPLFAFRPLWATTTWRHVLALALAHHRILLPLLAGAALLTALLRKQLFLPAVVIAALAGCTVACNSDSVLPDVANNSASFLIPALGIIIGCWLASSPATDIRWRRVLSAVAIALALFAGVLPGRPWHTSTGPYSPPVELCVKDDMARLRARVDSVAPQGKILADGFYDYALWYYGVGQGRLIRTLDFSSSTLLGLRMPVHLVSPKPVGRFSLEDVQIKLAGPHREGRPAFNYYLFHLADAGRWQIYRIMD